MGAAGYIEILDFFKLAQCRFGSFV